MRRTRRQRLRASLLQNSESIERESKGDQKSGPNATMDQLESEFGLCRGCSAAGSGDDAPAMTATTIDRIDFEAFMSSMSSQISLILAGISLLLDGHSQWDTAKQQVCGDIADNRNTQHYDSTSDDSINSDSDEQTKTNDYCEVACYDNVEKADATQRKHEDLPEGLVIAEEDICNSDSLIVRTLHNDIAFATLQPVAVKTRRCLKINISNASTDVPEGGDDELAQPEATMEQYFANMFSEVESTHKKMIRVMNDVEVFDPTSKDVHRSGTKHVHFESAPNI